ncbi:MAG: phosphatase PAP2 family protein [Candidatus Woesearchaeota archaeon]
MNFLKKDQKIQLSIIFIAVLLLISSIFADNIINEKISMFHGSVFDIIFNILSNFYILIFVLLIVSTFFMYTENKKEGILPLWLSFIAASIIVIILKLLVARERPIAFDTFSLFLYSFPSLHAAVCFAVVPILDIEFPKLKVLWISVGILVGLSRVYLQVHYLSDVIAGGIIGYCIGITAFYINEKYFYRIRW